MQKNTRRTTMSDIARELGVSTMAVSKALNGKPGISAKTREKILEKARAMNYQPNLIAKNLRVDQTMTIGVVMSDSSQSMLSSVLKGVEAEAVKAGYSVILSNTAQDGEAERRAVDVLLGKRIDGLILVAPLLTDAASLSRIIDFGVPYTTLMRWSNTVEMDAVVNDNFRGGYEIVDYLIRTGSDDLYFIHLPSNPGSNRLSGQIAACDAHGMTPRYSVSCPPQIQDGYDHMVNLLNNGLTGGTVCCGCDFIAIGVMEAILQRGFSIPGDFRVSGYDDIDLAGYLRVPLTTMSQPTFEMGSEGFRLLLERIRNPDRPVTKLVMPSTLVVREST